MNNVESIVTSEGMKDMEMGTHLHKDKSHKRGIVENHFQIK